MNVREYDLTNGSLLKGLAILAGPMFASALLQNLQSVIDLFWVGRLGSDAVAALAVSGTILMMLFPLVMGMATGTVAVVSRRIGERNHAAASDAAGQSLSLALLVGAVAGLVGWFYADELCTLLGTPPAIGRLAGLYLRISFAGSFSVFLLFMGTSILQAAGNTVIPMAVMILANILNIVLDPLLIFGYAGMPRLGVAGAALATVCSQVAACAVIILLLSVGGVAGIRVTARRWRLQLADAWVFLRIGVPSSGQMLARSLMALALMRIVAGFGTAAMAAYGIGLRFHMLALMPAFALGNAAATLVGQNLGAHKPDRARAAGWQAAGIDVCIMVVLAALMMAFGPSLVQIFDHNPEVVLTGTRYIRITSTFYVFMGLAVVLGRALQGAGDTIPSMLFTIISLWGIQVPLAVLLSRRFQPPTDGIWWAIAAAVTLHGVLVTAWYASGRWTRRRV